MAFGFYIFYLCILLGERLKVIQRLDFLSLPQGGRRVLYLYGYTNQQIDGLSFPDEVTEPDSAKVAAVTLEVMTLRTEVDMLIKVCISSHVNTLNTSWFCVRNSPCAISYTSVHLGHPPSHRVLQRYHPIHHPAGLYKRFQELYT